jgi:hypothetical protein
MTELIHVIDQMNERLAMAGEDAESATISDQKGRWHKARSASPITAPSIRRQTGHK